MKPFDVMSSYLGTLVASVYKPTMLWEQRHAVAISVVVRCVHLSSTGLLFAFMLFQFGLDNYGYPIANIAFLLFFVIYYVAVCVPFILNHLFGPIQLMSMEVLTTIFWITDCIIIGYTAGPGDCGYNINAYLSSGGFKVCKIGKALITLTILLSICSLYALRANYLYMLKVPDNDDEITILQFGGIFRKDIPIEYDKVTGEPIKKGALFRRVKNFGTVS